MLKATSSIIAAGLLAGAAVAQTASAPAPAAPQSAGGGLASKLINVPSTNWNVYGQGQTVTRLDKGGPQGYPAVHVVVPGKAPNPWDIGALSPIDKPIAAGDVVMVAVYLRAPELKDGETAAIPFLGVTGSSAPYENIASGSAALGKEWKVYFASGKAPRAFAAGGAQASVHLAAAKHVIELGPIRIYDLGPDFDMARLPKN